MTLKTKREVVRRFKAGQDIARICRGLLRMVDPLMSFEREEAEQVIRDYMNGKFSLKPRGRK